MIPDFDEAHRPPDSETLRAALGTLRAQEAKGKGKYGTDLDGANLTAAQLLTHAAEEAADLLMYLTALRQAVEKDAAAAKEWRERIFGPDENYDDDGMPRARQEACVTEEDCDRTCARVAALERELEQRDSVIRAYGDSLALERRRAEVSRDDWAQTRRKEIAALSKVAELEAEVKNLVWRDEAATRERVGWVEKCRELEAELSATERTADAERERAKRAERLLESESARVAELEARFEQDGESLIAFGEEAVALKARVAELEESVSLAEGRVLQEQEGRRLDARAAEAREDVLKREIRTRDKKLTELEASLSSTETHRQALAHELSRAQQLEDAALKTIARKDRRIGELEAENATLRERLDYYGGFADPDRPFADPPDFAHPSPAPTTRPLTTADRLPDVGDYLARPGGGRMECDIRGAGFVLSRFIYRAEDGAPLGGVYLTGRALRDGCYQYLSRADGGPVTVEAQP